MNEQDLKEIELSLEQAQHKVDLYQALQRLNNNADFKSIFTDYYLSKYATRLVKLKASLSVQTEQNQLHINNQLNAIGHLSQFMQYIEQEGQIAEASIQADKEERERIWQEDINNG